MIPNYTIKDDRCEKDKNDDWIARVAEDGIYEDEQVQEIIHRADSEGHDAFVMNVNHTDWE